MSTPVTAKIEVAFGADPDGAPYLWDWTDVSGRWLVEPVTIGRGQSNETARPQPASVTVTLRNPDGAFTPRLPTSTYYPNVKRGTPLRISIVGPTSFLVLGGDVGSPGVTTPDHASLDITGDIDIRFDADLFSWESGRLIGNSDDVAETGWRLRTSDNKPVLIWEPSVGAQQSVTATTVLPVELGRLAVRATLDVDNGAAGHTVTFYTADTIDGTWVQLGDPVVTAGTTTIAAGDDVLAVIPTPSGVGQERYGSVFAAQVRNGIAGTVVANPDFTVQAEGATSFVDSAGRTWTVQGTSALTTYHTRFIGHVAEWALFWPDESTNEARVAVTAAGSLRRRQQGQPSLLSPLRRVLGRLTVAYWPLEDSDGATSAFGGSRSIGSFSSIPAVATGSPSFGATSGLPGSLPAVELDGATLSVPLAATNVGVFVYMAAAPGSTQEILRVETDGTWQTVTVSVDATNVTLAGVNTSGSTFSDTATATEFYGQWVYLDLEIVDNGANVDHTLTWRPVASPSTVHTVFESPAGATPTGGTLVRLTGPPGAAASFAHLYLVAASVTLGWSDIENAARGHAGETAGARIERLCDEENARFEPVGDLTDTEPMGVQQASTLTDLLFECSAADMGLLYELRDWPGFGYRTRTSLYNQTAALSIDGASDRLVQPFRPVYDDQRLRNDVTVERVDGSSAQYVDQDSVDDEDTYDDTVPVNVETDSQLEDQAAWRVHTGAWPEMRYPSLSIELTDTGDALRTAWIDLGLGDLVEVTALPSQHPTDDVRSLVVGYDETFTPFLWRPKLNTVPAGPYTVGVLDDDTPSTALARLDSDGSTLASAIDSDDTSLSVATPIGPLWTTDGDYMPMDVFVGGERMTVTAVSGAASPQTFTVTRSTNSVVKSHSAGAVLSLAVPFVLSL